MTALQARPAGASESPRRPDPSTRRHVRAPSRLPRLPRFSSCACRIAAGLLVLFAAALGAGEDARAQTSAIWSVTITPATVGTSVGVFNGGVGTGNGSFSVGSRTFTFDGTTYQTNELYKRNDGKIIFRLKSAGGHFLQLPAKKFVLLIGTQAFHFHGTDDYDSSRYVIDASGLTLSAGTPVTVSLSEAPTLTISAEKTSVIEGTDTTIVFTIEADRAPANDLMVPVAGSYVGSFLINPPATYNLRLPAGPGTIFCPG